MGRPILNDRLAARTDLDVSRGRDAFRRIGDMVKDKQAQGYEVLSVTINRRVADAMKAFYCSFSQFDGVLPSRCRGAPLVIDLSANEDFVIRARLKAN
jgi:hypothetical protein